jgi:SHS2 domain-containing protein
LLDFDVDPLWFIGGADLKEAFENVALAMFDYITEIETIDIDESMSSEIAVSGHDLDSLLYNFLDELLFNFCADPFLVCREVKITSFDRVSFSITAKWYDPNSCWWRFFRLFVTDCLALAVVSGFESESIRKMRTSRRLPTPTCRSTSEKDMPTCL